MNTYKAKEVDYKKILFNQIAESRIGLQCFCFKTM